MPGPQTSSTLQYALIAVVVFVFALTMVVALAPILDLIGDGFKLLSAVLSGDLSGIGSLIK